MLQWADCSEITQYTLQSAALWLFYTLLFEDGWIIAENSRVQRDDIATLATKLMFGDSLQLKMFQSWL